MRPEKIRRKLIISIIFAGSLIALAVLIKLLYVYTHKPTKKIALHISTPLNIIVKKIEKPDLQWHTIAVTSGDTLVSIFSCLKIDQKNPTQLLRQSKFLVMLYPHEKLLFQINFSHQVMSMASKLIFIFQRGNFIKNKFIKKIDNQLIISILADNLIIIQHSLIQNAKNLV